MARKAMKKIWACSMHMRNHRIDLNPKDETDLEFRITGKNNKKMNFDEDGRAWICLGLWPVVVAREHDN
jgi:hypothetical protein